MPRIPSYPLAGSVSNDDLMLIDDVSEIYTTKSLKLSTLKGYVNTGQATTTYVDDKVVSGASFNTSTGILTLTRTDGVDVTEDLDGRYLRGAGIANYIPRWGAEQSLSNSAIYEDDTSGQARIAIGTTTADARLHVDGTGKFTDQVTIPLTPVANTDAASKAYVDSQSGGGGGTVTEINTAGPIAGGTITTSGTISITKADGTTDGYLSSTDWNTFNNKSSFDGQYSSLTGAPTLAAVATSGDYNDLLNQPTIPTVPANIVETVTTTDGSFIDLTPNTATDGAVTITADLSATGTADATTFLRGDNTWAVPPGGGGGSGVTSIIAGDGISIDPVTGTGNVTVTAGTAVASTWRTFYRKFTGNELKNAFAGSPSNEIVLVNGAPNKVIILGVEATFFLDFSTGTTDYVDNGQSLAIYPDTTSGFQFPTSINLGQIGSISSTNPFGIRFKDTTTSYTQSAPTGAAIVLGSYGPAVSITAGDRDFIITFPYRVIDLS